MRGNYFIASARAEVEKVGSKGSAGAGFWKDVGGEGERSLLLSGFPAGITDGTGIYHEVRGLSATRS